MRGGKRVKYPWSVHLKICKRGKFFFGSGNLVTHGKFGMFIVTAAHVLLDAETVEAAIGCDSIDKNTQYLKADSWFMHDHYSRRNYNYDIGIVMIKSKHCVNCVAIKLPNIDYISLDSSVYTTIGWAQEGTCDIRYLSEANVRKMDDQEFLKTFECWYLHDGFLFGDHTPCEYDYGDSGAALINWDQSNVPVLFGILAGSSGRITPFVKIQPHLEWIETTLKTYLTQANNEKEEKA